MKRSRWKKWRINDSLRCFAFKVIERSKIVNNSAFDKKLHAHNCPDTNELLVDEHESLLRSWIACNERTFMVLHAYQPVRPRSSLIIIANNRQRRNDLSDVDMMPTGCDSQQLCGTEMIFLQTNNRQQQQQRREQRQPHREISHSTLIWIWIIDFRNIEMFDWQRWCITIKKSHRKNRCLFNSERQQKPDTPGVFSSLCFCLGSWVCVCVCVSA